MFVSPIEGHRLWAPHYDADCNPLLALENRMLRRLLAPIHARCFLDVACGTGRWMAYLAEKGGRVFGVDICAAMLAQAATKSILSGRSIQADAALLPVAAGIADTVLCSFAAGYLPDLKRAIAEMTRAVKKGGRVIVSDLHPAGVAAGWTRSFRLGEEVYEMQHFAPSVEEFRAAAQIAGLRCYSRLDAHFEEPERRYFRSAGKERMYAQLASVPAVWIGIWTKP
jgi:ubiquinone/menaquinone biosynthesis C-methylase UbiE